MRARFQRTAFFALGLAGAGACSNQGRVLDCSGANDQDSGPFETGGNQALPGSGGFPGFFGGSSGGGTGGAFASGGDPNFGTGGEVYSSGGDPNFGTGGGAPGGAYGVGGFANTGGAFGSGGAYGYGGNTNFGGSTGNPPITCTGGAPGVGVGDAGTVGGPSCAGLPATCGPCRNESCCDSPKVPGGTFYRGYDGVTYTDKSYPATVSDFRLDKYEITVGRFRKFVAAYTQDMIPAGAGKNPNNPSDQGWNTAWNDQLPPDATYLTSSDYLACGATRQTWTDAPGPNENQPVNCIDWYQAFAFCAWDGGRLPTEAEAGYAAAGGSQQREYPWGNTALGPNTDLAIYDCWYGENGRCNTFSSADIAPVGSAPAGNGKWGQADLSGNVQEIVLDSYAPTYVPTPCTNCANIAVTQYGTVWRGGDYAGGPTTLLNANRNNNTGRSASGLEVGARCARSAP